MGFLSNFRYTNLIYNYLFYFIITIPLFSGITKIVDSMSFIETIKTVFKLSDNTSLQSVALLAITDTGLLKTIPDSFKKKEVQIVTTAEFLNIKFYIS